MKMTSHTFILNLTKEFPTVKLFSRFSTMKNIGPPHNISKRFPKEVHFNIFFNCTQGTLSVASSSPKCNSM